MNTTHEIKFRISIVRNSPCSACFLTSKPFRIGGIDLFVFSMGCPLLFINLNQDILFFVKQQAVPIWQFFLTLDSFAVKKSFKAKSSSAFQLTSTNCTLFGNCSFDDAIVALVHLVPKHPTFSILSSRVSAHNYRRAAEKISILAIISISSYQLNKLSSCYFTWTLYSRNNCVKKTVVSHRGE